MRVDDVHQALDRLLEHELVEYDARHRVLRLTELPDAGEYPDNGNILKGWWSRFRTVPACTIRDAHIRTIRWIMEQGALDKGKTLSPHHHEAWGCTFGTIAIPHPRRRGVKRVADSDTSTVSQPGLFSPVAPGTVQQTSGSTAYPQADACSVDKSGVMRQLNEITGPETVPERLGEGEGEGEGDLWISPEIRNESPGRSRTLTPVLTLVPPYTVAQVLDVFRAHGTYDPAFDSTHQDGLSRAHGGWVSARLGLEDFRVLAQHRAKSRTDARWLATSDLASEVAHARAEVQRIAESLSMLREFVPGG